MDCSKMYIYSMLNVTQITSIFTEIYMHTEDKCEYVPSVATRAFARLDLIYTIMFDVFVQHFLSRNSLSDLIR